VDIKLEDVIELEDKLIKHEYGVGNFEILKGEKGIIVSAPHCIEQIRRGKIKQAETRTGTIAYYLQELIGCHAIFKTRFNEDDPNFTCNSKYRDALVKYIKTNSIKLLVDLHICSPKREADVYLGEGYQEDTPEMKIIEEALKINFQKHHFDNIGHEKRFEAKFPYGVSAYIHDKCDIPTIQLEINWHDLEFNQENGANKFFRILDSLAKALVEVEKKLAIY